jgi:hypothetical protein
LKIVIDDVDAEEIIKVIKLRLKLTEALSDEFIRESLHNIKVFDGKQADYGSRNISSFGFMGCVIRMSDKFERIKNLLGVKRKRAINESVMDNLDDIGVYTIIAKLCHKGKWPK